MKPRGFLTLKKCFKTDQGQIFVILFEMLFSACQTHFRASVDLDVAAVRETCPWDLACANPTTSWLGEEKTQEKNPFFCSSEEVIPGE